MENEAIVKGIEEVSFLYRRASKSGCWGGGSKKSGAPASPSVLPLPFVWDGCRWSHPARN